MRLLLIVAGLLLFASCQRDYPQDHPSRTASVSSIWDEIHVETRPEEQQTQQPQDEEPIEPSIELGPAFSESDTVDEALLPGVWVQFCLTKDEKMEPLPPNQQDLVELADSGQLVWHFIVDGKDTSQPGYWEKTKPGWVGMSLGDQPPGEVRLQMFGEDFFFFWSYNGSIGMWFARLPQNPPQRIEYNRFTSNLGDFQFDSVNENIFLGSAAGDYTRTIAGVYTKGLLIMRWEEPDTNAAGYAAFRVSSDWQELEGAWWIDDYQAAPFGGPYDAQPLLDSQVTPEDQP